MGKTVPGFSAATFFGDFFRIHCVVPGLGLWNNGTPNEIAIYVKRLGWITLSNNTIFAYANAANSESVLEINLQRTAYGCMSNTIVPADELPNIDPFNPPIPR